MFRKKKGRIDWKVNRTVQETIPYVRVHQKYDLIEINKDEYCRAYVLEDLNFSTSRTEDKEAMFRDYQSLLNSVPVGVRIQVNIINKNIDKEEFKGRVLLPYKYNRDKLDVLREELNTMLVDKMEQGRNNLTHEKVIVASSKSNTVEEAAEMFRQLDVIISSGVKKIGGLMQAGVKPLTAEEHLELLHDIYSPQLSGKFNAIRNIDGEKVKSFSFEQMVSQGLTTKDLIAPDSFEFKGDYFKVGEVYGRAHYFKSLPSSLSTSVLNDLASNQTNQVISLSYQIMEQTEAIKAVEGSIKSLNAQRIESQKRGSKAGYDGDLVNPSIIDRIENTKQFLRDMSSRNQKLFLLTGTVVVFGKTKEELDRFSTALVNKAGVSLITVSTLILQQEQGLSQTLPLGRKDIFVERTLNSDAAALFIPYDTQEFSHENGRYYGVNATSRNLVIYDRKTAANQNGFILGLSGSGKSFMAKAEMVNVMLGTDDDIVVIDPDAEYGALAKKLGGEVIPISLGSGYNINPLDMATNYGDGADPIPVKSDFITQLIQTIIGNKYTPLSPVEKSIIDRAVKEVYIPYFAKLEKVERKSMRHDDFNEWRRSITPTLVDLRQALLNSDEPEGITLGIALEQYTIGSFNLFSRTTNVNNNDRFVVYDVNSAGDNIRPLAMKIIMDAIWNRMLENRHKGKNTWIYIDEIYLMFDSEESVLLLQSMWKRARKYGGVSTGITQNIGDLLQFSAASTMLSNSEFIIMMNQATLDRENLISLLNISETQSSYITGAEPGEGLLYTGKQIVPFINKFPKDTDLYKVMTSDPDEILEYNKEREAEDNEHRGTKEETSN